MIVDGAANAVNRIIAIGRNALAAQTSGGEFNVAVGSYSLDENTFGDKNVALGYVALGKNTEEATKAAKERALHLNKLKEKKGC